MPSDRVYIQGGADGEEAGNYERTEGVGSRVLRLVVMTKDRWAGGRGISQGVRWDDFEKMPETNDQAEAELRNALAEGVDPLIQTEEIGELALDAAVVRDDAAAFELNVTDLTTGDAIRRQVKAGWKQ